MRSTRSKISEKNQRMMCKTSRRQELVPQASCGSKMMMQGQVEHKPQSSNSLHMCKSTLQKNRHREHLIMDTCLYITRKCVLGHGHHHKQRGQWRQDSTTSTNTFSYKKEQLSWTTYLPESVPHLPFLEPQTMRAQLNSWALGCHWGQKCIDKQLP